jgi:orotate phosphoribosyltransferase
MDPMDDRPLDVADLAARLDACCRLTGEFTLRSGQRSDTYFDKYRFEADPALLRRVAQALAPRVPPDAEVLAGLELGGIPVVTILSALTALPAAFVRKAAKPYGTARLAEGAEVAGRRVAVVEDVISTGGQVVRSVADLRAAGALVTDVLCVIDRRPAERDDLLGAAGLRLHAVLTRTDLDAAAAASR